MGLLGLGYVGNDEPLDVLTLVHALTLQLGSSLGAKSEGESLSHAPCWLAPSTLTLASVSNYLVHCRRLF